MHLLLFYTIQEFRGVCSYGQTQSSAHNPWIGLEHINKVQTYIYRIHYCCVLHFCREGKGREGKNVNLKDSNSIAVKNGRINTISFSGCEQTISVQLHGEGNQDLQLTIHSSQLTIDILPPPLKPKLWF